MLLEIDVGLTEKALLFLQQFVIGCDRALKRIGVNSLPFAKIFVELSTLSKRGRVGKAMKAGERERAHMHQAGGTAHSLSTEMLPRWCVALSVISAVCY